MPLQGQELQLWSGISPKGVGAQRALVRWRRVAWHGGDIPNIHQSPVACLQPQPSAPLPSRRLFSMSNGPGAPGFQLPKTFCPHHAVPWGSHRHLHARNISQRATECHANEN